MCAHLRHTDSAYARSIYFGHFQVFFFFFDNISTQPAAADIVLNGKGYLMFPLLSSSLNPVHSIANKLAV